MIIDKHHVYEYKTINGKKTKVRVMSPATRISEGVTIEDGTTLRDLFKIVLSEQDRWDPILYSALRGFPLKDYVQKATSCPAITANPEIDFLEVSISYEVWENKLERFPSFHGRGPRSENGNRQSYAIEFEPIANLLDYPVKIDNVVDISGFNKYKHWNEDDTSEDRYATITYVKGIIEQPSLYDVMFAIFYEISFFGLEEDKEVKLSEFKKAIEDAI